MEYKEIISELEQYVSTELTEKRRKHTLGVRDTALALSKRYNADSEKACVAALAHDMYRGLRGDELRQTVRELGLDPKYEDDPNLAHGKIAAIMLRRAFGVEDEDILNAVSFHTTGRPDMSVLEKVVYLADCIEPNRDYPGVENIRKASEKGLDEACLTAMKGTIKHVTDQGAYLDPDTLEAADFLEKLLKETK